MRTFGNSYTVVPNDIPDTVKTVMMWNTQIAMLRKDDFSHLNVCYQLDLSQNKISKIEPGAFN